MPNMNGLEFLVRVRSDERWKALPVLMLHHGRQQCDHHGHKAGATAYMTKPFFEKDLQAKILDCLGMGFERGKSAVRKFLTATILVAISSFAPSSRNDSNHRGEEAKKLFHFVGKEIAVRGKIITVGKSQADKIPLSGFHRRPGSWIRGRHLSRRV
jgi:DNA-binding response OmpR family regulator